MSTKTEAGPVALALALAVLRGDREALLMCHQHPITKKVDVDARYHLARYDEAIAGLEALATHPPAQEQPAPAVPSAAVLLAEQVLHMELATERGKRARELARQVLDTAHDVHEGECAAVLRNLASYLGAGGYNAAAVDPQVFREKIMWGIEEVRRATHPTPAAQEQPAPYFNRQAVERAISSAENPAPGTMQLNDGKERVTLPGGTLRRMLAIIDQLATHPTPAAQEQPAPAVPQGLRAAAIQALVALDNATDAQSNPQRRDFPTIHDFGQMRRAGDALRAALATHPAPAERAEPGCRSPAQDLMLCPNSACGWMGRCLAAEPFQPAERAEQPPRDAVQQGLSEGLGLAPERLSEDRARTLIEAWLDEHAPGYPDYSLCEDGDDAWAFWIAEKDTTSYLHSDGRVEWYGTGWPEIYQYDGDSGLWSSARA